MTSRLVGYGAVAVLLCVGICAALMTSLSRDEAGLEDTIWAAFQAGQAYAALEIAYPFNETLFPPEIIAPRFHWKDPQSEADTWLVTIELPDGKEPMSFLSRSRKWRPKDEQWEAIKRRSLEKEARVTIVGVNHVAPEEILSAGSITIGTSKDEVGTPIFYREVNLPFIAAAKDPTHIRWRFGTVSSQTQPPVVLENLPVCGNCHSFCANGSLVGMDVDYANDKGSYAITPVEKEIVLAKNKIITWSDYKRGDGELTFGLLSQVSPDGRYVISTAKDRSVFVPKPDLEFSQLFFPIKGILVVYDRAAGTFHALPGANDKKFVQSNPTWSPDGKEIVFARTKVHHLKTAGGEKRVLLTAEESREFLQEGKTFLFDLYRIPFDDGKGGKSEPLEGASNNGMSNYFPKYSPDGKWIVFCKAKSFMLLQPDSELYIMPAAGGKARRMRCNTARMNSWHSWSPNSRWLVFSSKHNGPYTQLFLTHVDEEGRSTSPVLLENFCAPDRAANIPEFANVKPGTIERIRQEFVDDQSFRRAGFEALRGGDEDLAEQSYRKALKFNPRNAKAQNELGVVLLKKGMLEEARAHFAKAIEYQPRYALPYSNLGFVSYNEGKLEQAIEYFRKAVEIDPQEAEPQNRLGVALLRKGMIEEARAYFAKAIECQPRYALPYSNLGSLLYNEGKLEQAIEHFRKAIEIDPQQADAHKNWGQALADLGEFDQAIEHFKKALKINPESASFHCDCGNALGKLGKADQAIAHYRKALEINPKHAPAHNALGLALAQRGRLDQAIEHFRKAVEINPNHDGFYSNWGNVLGKLGKWDQAIEQYKRALEINPESTLSHCNWGNVLMNLRKPDEAIAHFRKALEISPKYAPAHNALGLALAQRGRLDEAIEHFRKAVEINPKDDAFYYNWGNALGKLGKADQAIEQYKKAVEINPGHVLAHTNLGILLAQQGRIDQAIAHYEKAITVNPQSIHARISLGEVLAKQGKFEPAIVHLRKAVEINPNHLRAVNGLAWLLATCPKDGLREGAQAVKLAERACEATGYKIPTLMDTLAAAYAEAGRYPEAVATATKALGLVQPNQQSLAERIRQRLEHYRAGKPYRIQP